MTEIVNYIVTQTPHIVINTHLLNFIIIGN